MAMHRGINPQDNRDGCEKHLFQMVERTGKISWGEPAMVAAASVDKICPACGTDRVDGFQIEFTGAHCTGIYCPRCGFTFGVDCKEPDSRQRLMFGPKCSDRYIPPVKRKRKRPRTKK